MPLNNVTSISNTSGDIVSLLGILLAITIISVVLSALLTVSRSYHDYKRLKNIINIIIKLLDYTAYGLLTIVAIGAPCLLGYAVYQHAINNPGSTGNFLKNIGIVVLAILGTASLGYLTKERIWKRIFEFHKKSVQEKEYKQNLKQLPGGENI